MLPFPLHVDATGSPGRVSHIRFTFTSWAYSFRFVLSEVDFTVYNTSISSVLSFLVPSMVLDRARNGRQFKWSTPRLECSSSLWSDSPITTSVGFRGGGFMGPRVSLHRQGFLSEVVFALSPFTRFLWSLCFSFFYMGVGNVTDLGQWVLYLASPAVGQFSPFRDDLGGISYASLMS